MVVVSNLGLISYDKIMDKNPLILLCVLLFLGVLCVMYLLFHLPFSCIWGIIVKKDRGAYG